MLLASSLDAVSTPPKAGNIIASHRDHESRDLVAEIAQSIVTVATSPPGISSSYFDQSARGVSTRSPGALALRVNSRNEGTECAE
jgi:hypothetical protein